jgi:hypothetical protein
LRNGSIPLDVPALDPALVSYLERSIIRSTSHHQPERLDP